MLIVDTGVLVAAADRNDPDYHACSDLLETDDGPLVTTELVIAEAAHLIDRQVGAVGEIALYTSIVEQTLAIESLIGTDWQTRSRAGRPLPRSAPRWHRRQRRRHR